MKLSEDQKKQLMRHRQVFQRVVQSDPGKEFINALEEIVGGALFDGDPGRMAYKVGQYELVEYIKSMGAAGGDSDYQDIGQ